jgi:hypothetical protein
VFIQVNIQLGEGDSFAYTPDAAAAQVLAALGGNPTKDYCTANVSMQPTTGDAGTAPEGPPIVP